MRGLSVLFWGMPLALVICVTTGVAGVGGLSFDALRRFGIIPSMLTTAWILYGLGQLGCFQKQERIWTRALDRARLLALVNFGLSPFLFWWNRHPDETYFRTAVEVLAISALVFLAHLNLVLRRLTAMLPDEHLREETRQFTVMNRMMVLVILGLAILLKLFLKFPEIFPSLGNYLERIEPSGLWVIMFLVLLPMAITMALIWKIKEVILEGVFGR